MNIFDAITEKERVMIINWINHYADGGEELHDEKLNHILRHWAREKERIFHIFGDKLILEKEVVVEKDVEHLNREFYKVLNDRATDPAFYDRYWAAIHSIEQIFYDRSGDDGYYGTEPYLFRSLYNVHTLSKNRYEGTEGTITIEGKPVRIQRGAKPMRLLQRIFIEHGFGDIFEEFRLKHSQILNERTFKGTMCLSIHPLDYMTMSDNECGWDSCMNWRDVGGYRRGTVEMMNSPMAIVAYLKSGSTVLKVPGGYEWNSKKWRELILYSFEDFICGVKGYPMWNKNLEKIAVDWVKSLTSENWGDTETIYPWNNDYRYMGTYKKYFEPESNTMYNDFNDEVGHTGCFTLDGIEDCINVEFNYSGISSCVKCGCDIDWEEGDECCLICDCCDVRGRCDCCGERHYEGDLYEVDGYHYCEYCYDNETITDDIFGEVHTEETMDKIYTYDSEKGLYSSWAMNVSERLIYELKEEDEYAIKSFKNVLGENVHLYVAKLKNSAYWIENRYFIDVQDFKEDLPRLLNAINYWGDIEDFEQEFRGSAWINTTTSNLEIEKIF